MKLKKALSAILATTVLTASFSILGCSEKAEAATVNSIPNTSRSIKNYDKTFMSLTGYASVNNAVNDRSKYVGTSYYRSVSNERQFLDAVLNAQSGKVKVIEITKDLNLGWKELNLNANERNKYKFVSKYEDPTNGYTNPTLEAKGVSKLNISDTNGLTIFSTKGNTIRHVELKLQSSSNDIAIRNLKFDDMWQFDDEGKHKEVGWTFIKVNGAKNVWIDHCKFTNAADGNIDIENGSSGLTFSWCEFGAETTENPDTNSAIYKSVNYMEQKYKKNQLKSNSLYYKMRKGGASVKQIMAYEAYHSKCHLVGSGDKDFTDYIDSNGKNYKDGNQGLRLTLAYCKYNNMGQRIPLVRQGTAHMFNCVVDDSGHMNILKNVSAIRNCNVDNLARCINARNGASVGADTCVFNGVNQPITGSEIQGDDTSNMHAPWDKLFKNAYNHALIVNSKVTNSDGSYTGSSWDNNGDNLFTKGFKWHDKSTIGKWAWSSSIKGVNKMSKSNPPSNPFSFNYNYNEKLPYAYNVVPLNNVEATIKSYSGAGKVNMSNSDWLKTKYGSSSNSGATNNKGIVNGGIYYIKNLNSQLYLDVVNGVDANGSNIRQWTGNGSTAQRFKVVSVGGGYYKLVSQTGSKKRVVDVNGNKALNGQNISLYDDRGTDNQKFKFIDNGNGVYQIATKVSKDKSLVEVANASKAAGGNVQQWANNSNNCQKWVLELVK